MLRMILVLNLCILCSLLGCKKNPRSPGSDPKSNQPQSKCLQIRAAFDVGSGATKMKVSEVDTCQGTLVRILFPVQSEEFAKAIRKVAYKEDLKQSFKQNQRKKGTLSNEIVQKGVKALLSLKALAQSYGATAWAGVATSAFRQATNGKDVIQKLSQESGVPISVISQTEEGMLAFYAVRALFPKIPAEQLLVWDIGGSSMQMVAQQPSKSGTEPQHSLYLGHVASVPMATYIAETLQGKTGKQIFSPNPIDAATYDKALQYVVERANREVSEPIKQRAKTGRVVGVGGVHFFSVSGQIKEKDGYSVEGLAKAIQARLGLDDQALAQKNNPKAVKQEMRFIRTQLTNLILVHGFMKALGIQHVTTASVNLANGLLLSPKYWKK